MDNSPIQPITHPGEILADELKARKIKQIDFSERIGMLPSQLNETIKGKRPVTVELALWLEWYFIGTADYWTNAQRVYDLEMARLAFKPVISKTETKTT